MTRFECGKCDKICPFEEAILFPNGTWLDILCKDCFNKHFKNKEKRIANKSILRKLLGKEEI